MMTHTLLLSLNTARTESKHAVSEMKRSTSYLVTLQSGASEPINTASDMRIHVILTAEGASHFYIFLFSEDAKKGCEEKK